MSTQNSTFGRIEIVHGRSSLAVAPERGGMLTHLVLDGASLLYLDESTFLDASKNVRGGIPILFPICGPLQGSVYPLKQHGFARNLPWTVAAQDQTSVTLELMSSPETEAVYPFRFRLRYRYWLRDDALRIEQRFENCGDRPMPMCSGLHPYFAVTDKSALQLEIPASQQSPNPDGAPQPFAATLDFDQEVIDAAFVDMRQPIAGWVDRAASHRLRITAHPAYRYFVFWTLRGQKFCCLEPWTARANALNSGHDVLTVAAAEALDLWVEISRSPVAPAP